MHLLLQAHTHINKYFYIDVPSTHSLIMQGQLSIIIARIYLLHFLLFSSSTCPHSSTKASCWEEKNLHWIESVSGNQGIHWNCQQVQSGSSRGSCFLEHSRQISIGQEVRSYQSTGSVRAAWSHQAEGGLSATRPKSRASAQRVTHRKVYSPGKKRVHPLCDNRKPGLNKIIFLLQPTRDASGAAIAIFTAHLHHPQTTTHQTTLQVRIIEVALYCLFVTCWMSFFLYFSEKYIYFNLTAFDCLYIEWRVQFTRTAKVIFRLIISPNTWFSIKMFPVHTQLWHFL